jgi:hypothetical protein
MQSAATDSTTSGTGQGWRRFDLLLWQHSAYDYMWFLRMRCQLNGIRRLHRNPDRFFPHCKALDSACQSPNSAFGYLHFPSHKRFCTPVAAFHRAEQTGFTAKACPHILAIIDVVLHAPADHQAGFIQLPRRHVSFKTEKIARSATVGGRGAVHAPQV